MNKFFNQVALVATLAVAVVSAELPAQAQFDTWGQTRTVAIGPKTLFNANAGVTTNDYIDLRNFVGVVKLDLIGQTNQSGGTLTCAAYTSDDATNWTALTYAACSSTVFKYTNNIYGTQSPIGTNTFLLPGVWTTPSVATAGFASPYLLANPFTNTAAITFVASGYGALQSIGFSVEDQKRYLMLVWSPGGTSTNATTGGFLTGRTGYPFP